MKILNLYAGIGGNRKLWKDVDVTAVEIDPEIAKIYEIFYPQDKVIVGDAHQYLLDHYEEFDFIWSSPPCPTHSKMRLALAVKVYPNMELYQEILFLKQFFKGKWVVENVVSYYDPLIKPIHIGKHYFWSNFNIEYMDIGTINIAKATKEDLAKYLGMPILKRLFLRNCVHPKIGEHILNDLR